MASIAGVARAHGITDQNLCRWRDKHGRIGRSKLAELKALRAENQLLKRIVRCQTLEIDAYKEIAEGKWQARQPSGAS